MSSQQEVSASQQNQASLTSLINLNMEEVIAANLKTTPIDKRFHTTNQANHCWNRYNEWVMCLKKTSGDEDQCKPMRQLSLSICPDAWVEKWDEERDEGKFPGVQYSG